MRELLTDTDRGYGGVDHTSTGPIKWYRMLVGKPSHRPRSRSKQGKIHTSDMHRQNTMSTQGWQQRRIATRSPTKPEKEASESPPDGCSTDNGIRWGPYELPDTAARTWRLRSCEGAKQPSYPSQQRYSTQAPQPAHQQHGRVVVVRHEPPWHPNAYQYVWLVRGSLGKTSARRQFCHPSTAVSHCGQRRRRPIA